MKVFSKGNIIIGTQSHNLNVEREILKVRKTGYTWKYLDSNRDYISENSNDPFFEWGWRVKEVIK